MAVDGRNFSGGENDRQFPLRKMPDAIRSRPAVWPARVVLARPA
jgi:hypothetical protein